MSDEDSGHVGDSSSPPQDDNSSLSRESSSSNSSNKLEETRLGITVMAPIRPRETRRRQDLRFSKPNQDHHCIDYKYGTIKTAFFPWPWLLHERQSKGHERHHTITSLARALEATATAWPVIYTVSLSGHRQHQTTLHTLYNFTIMLQ